MLRQFLGDVDQKLFNAWYQRVFEAVNLLEGNLNQIDFGGDTPAEIIELKTLLTQFKDTQDQAAVIQALNKMKTLIDQIQQKYDFNHIAINHLFFQNRRAFNNFASPLFTQATRYGQAILKPTERQRENPQIDQITAAMIEHTVGNVSESLVANLDTNILPLLPKNMGADSLVVTSIKDRSTLPKTESMLEQKLGKIKYAALQSQKGTDSFEETNAYLAEQIYGQSFEIYYSQIASIYELLETINNIAAQSDNEQAYKEKKSQLMAEFGISAIESKESLEYFDAIAKELGFSDAKSLFNNYKKLTDPDSYETFAAAKRQFMQIGSNPDIPKERDPLEHIKKLSEHEYNRLRKEMKHDPQMAQSNTTHMDRICYLGMDMIAAIEGAQRMKAVSKNVIQDYLMPSTLFGDQQNFFVRAVMGAAQYGINALNLKSYLDYYLFSGMYGEAQVLNQHSLSIREHANANWFAVNQKALETKLIRRRRLLDEVLAKPANDDETTERLAEYWYQFKKAQNIGSESTHLEHQTTEDLREKYEDYRDVYEHRTLKTVRSFAYPELEGFIANARNDHQRLMSRRTSLNSEQNQILATEAEFNRRENRFFSRARRWFDSRLSDIGIKTASKLKREQQKRDFEQRKSAIQRELDLNEIAIDIHDGVMQSAATQLVLFQSNKAKSFTELRTSNQEIMVRFINAYEQLVQDSHLFVSGQISEKELAVHQKAYSAIENELQLSLGELYERLTHPQAGTQLSATDTFALLTLVKQDTASVNDFHPVIVGLGKDQKPPVLVVLNKITQVLQEQVSVNEKNAQQLRLAAHNQALSSLLSKMNITDIGDPYIFIFEKHPELIEGLTQDNVLNLFKHVASLMTDRIDAQSSTLDKKELEALYRQYRSSYYLYAHKGEKTPQTQALSEHYHLLSDQLANHLTVQYGSLRQGPFKELRLRLSDLDSDLSNHLASVSQAKEKADSLKRSQESWLSRWNPFNRTTIDHVQAAYDFYTACVDQYNLFAKSYLTFIEQFQHLAKTELINFDVSELNFLIAHLENHLLMLDQIIASDKFGIPNTDMQTLRAQYSQILQSAQGALKQHPHMLAQTADTTIQHLEHVEIRLAEIEQRLNTGLAQAAQFNADLHREFTEMLSTLTASLASEKVNLQQIKASSSQNRRLEILTTKLHELQQSQSNYQIYQQITQGQVPIIPQHCDKAVLATAFLLALDTHPELIAHIMQHPKGIDIAHLSKGLLLAAQRGDLNSIQLIAKYRKDITFNADDITRILQAAFSHQHPDIASELLLSLNPELNLQSTQLLATHLANDQLPMFELQKNWIDNDAVILAEMRKCYLCELALLETLDKDIEQLEAQAQTVNVEDPLLKQNMNHLLRKVDEMQTTAQAIRDKMLAFYVDKYVDNPQRKAELLRHWNLEMDEFIGGYHQRIMHALGKASKAPMVETADEVTNVMERLDIIEPEVILAKEDYDERARLMQEQADREQRFVDHQDQLKSLVREKYWQIGGIRKAIAHLKHEVTNDNRDQYNATLSELINLCAAKNQTDVLDVLLGAIDNLRLREEIARSALSQAMEHGHTDAVTYFLRKQAYKGFEEDYIKQLIELHKSNLVAFKRIGALVLATIPTPYSSQLQTMIDTLNNDMENPHISPVARGNWQRWVADSDGPYLDKIRSAYLFCEKCYRDQTDDLFNNFDLLINQAWNEAPPTPEQVQAYEKKLQEIKAAHTLMQEIFNQIKVDIIAACLPNISEGGKSKRLNPQQGLWQGELDKMIKQYEKQLHDSEELLQSARSEVQRKASVKAEAGSTTQSFEKHKRHSKRDSSTFSRDSQRRSTHRKSRLDDPDKGPRQT